MDGSLAEEVDGESEDEESGMKSPAMTMVDSVRLRVPKPLRSMAVTGAESGK